MRPFEAQSVGEITAGVRDRLLVRQPRFERGTFGSGGRRSIQLSYWRMRCCNNLASDCLLLKPFRLPFVKANELREAFV